ncbi:CinA family nicotinamide mononucleotide deamidase-related protein [Flavobacterium salilacus subsp. salilacus]|uniref:CinA family nicotinamide mononucleotide deamidase-related protein n=1 Tax=Flavobacterium TaxID=237 RepID=UPI0010758747|nr:MULTISPECIES: CinA family nicotinamide mononucleotide deamidase-related protein [Flavobacterium]KAF2519424.1 CinA family nicotinamide mononucleotide deamidase-related protein [Flavobacterium salilacus subsp. salilacus]MBE1614684.1 CinA family nicotinamide mononucleotide deamidase-related protein [Flavobacterium sp. SaA2.13]
MRAAIVTVGDEILIGQITDTNSGYIAKALDKIGIGVYEMRSVSDERQHILNTLSTLQNHVEVVIITGGLGPTKDDITKKTLCEYFDDELVINQEVLTHVVTLIEQVLQRAASQMNKDQALVPSRSTVLFNNVGTAPGMWMEKEGTVFISLPGVPYEMKEIMVKEVLPRLIAKYKRPYILHKTILTYGQGESIVAERIEDWENNLPDYIKLAYLPSPGRVRLRLSARGIDELILLTGIAAEAEKLKALIGDIIVGYEEDETLEVVVGKLLTEQKKTIAVAESCTGGKLAQVLTAAPGASNYFGGGVVTYSIESKVALLGIDKDFIDKNDVVSAEVAQAMAASAKALFGTDYALATTGNAGPTKEEGSADVGTVFIGFATPGGVYSEEFKLGQPREKVIDRAVNKALEKIYKEILKN